MALITRRNKNIRRPRKGTAEKHRRLKNQKRRLVALGVSEEKLEKLSSKEIRQMVLRPGKIKA